MDGGPTVGREFERGRVDAALGELPAGTAAWLAVLGEPGIGKTRVLSELRRRADERGHLVLAGSAAEFERDVPFSVWVDALDAYAAAQDLRADPGWGAELLDELAEILPSLRGAPATGPPAIADERYRAHRAVRRLIELFAARRPLVLVLDDLHWADPASIELIASLLRRGPAAPALVALAYRPGQAPERLVAALAAPLVRRIELAPLSESQAAELLGGVDARSVAAIYGHGGGNPFYLEQLARAGARATRAPSDVARARMSPGRATMSPRRATAARTSPPPWRPRSPTSSIRSRWPRALSSTRRRWRASPSSRPSR